MVSNEAPAEADSWSSSTRTLPPPRFFCLGRTSVIDQHPAHLTRGHGKEVLTVLEFHPLPLELQV
jgi:hypothetical protein